MKQYFHWWPITCVGFIHLVYEGNLNNIYKFSSYCTENHSFYSKWPSVNDERAANQCLFWESYKHLNTLRGPIAELFNVRAADAYSN
jgi:hypothetical protein